MRALCPYAVVCSFNDVASAVVLKLTKARYAVQPAVIWRGQSFTYAAFDGGAPGVHSARRDRGDPATRWPAAACPSFGAEHFSSTSTQETNHAHSTLETNHAHQRP